MKTISPFYSLPGIKDDLLVYEGMIKKLSKFERGPGGNLYVYEIRTEACTIITVQTKVEMYDDKSGNLMSIVGDIKYDLELVGPYYKVIFKLPPTVSCYYRIVGLRSKASPINHEVTLVNTTNGTFKDIVKYSHKHLGIDSAQLVIDEATHARPLTSGDYMRIPIYNPNGACVLVDASLLGGSLNHFNLLTPANRSSVISGQHTITFEWESSGSSVANYIIEIFKKVVEGSGGVGSDPLGIWELIFREDDIPGNSTSVGINLNWGSEGDEYMWTVMAKDSVGHIMPCNSNFTFFISDVIP